MSKKLQFYQYDFAKDGYLKPPPRSLNGGLYGGEPFLPGAPWGNVPIVPEATIYTNEAIAIQNEVPHQARFQYHATRPGNSFVEWRGLSMYPGTRENWGPYNMACLDCKVPEKGCDCEDVVCPSSQTAVCNKNNCVQRNRPTSYSKYSYVL